MLCGGHLGRRKRRCPNAPLGHELVLVEHMRGARHVAGDEDVVGHHPVDVERAAAGVAGHPPETGWPAAQPSSHSTLRIDPNDGHHHIDVERSCHRRSRARAHVPVGVALERLHRTPRCAGRRRRRAASPRRSHRSPRPARPTSGASPRSATVTGRSRSQHTEAISEPMKPEPTIRTPRRGDVRATASLQPGGHHRCAAVNSPSRAASCGVGPRPRPGPGGDQQPVVVHLCRRWPAAPAGWRGPGRSRPHPAATRASTGRSRGELGVIGGHPALEDLFGQRRPVIGLVRLVADDGERPRKPSRATLPRHAARPGTRRR